MSSSPQNEQPGKKLRVGTSGYSYADWVGPIYPPGVPKAEWLGLYAQRFSTVEINSTYYGVAAPATYARMRDRVGDDFVFSVKAPGAVTHERENAPEPILQDFFTRIAPLDPGPILLQFPFSFAYVPEHRIYLARVLDACTDRQAVVEFRHDSWVRGSVVAGLRERGVALASVDLPALPGLPPREEVLTGRLGYLRLHGRNAAKWWRHEQAWERYDYRYPREELAEWVPRVRRLLAEAAEVFVYANNHFQGQAVEAIEMLEGLLGEE